LLRAESRQLKFVFADNSQEGEKSRTSNVSEEKAFLLHQASVKEANDSATPAVGDSHRSLEQAASMSNLARALLKVTRNQGAAGVDGRSVKEVVDDAPRLLPKLRRELLSGAHRPGATTSRLTSSEQEQLKQRIDAGPTAEDGVCTLRGKDIQRILEDEFGKVRSLGTVYYLLHQLGYSSLVPRPQHRQTDPEAQATYKKSFRRGWQK